MEKSKASHSSSGITYEGYYNYGVHSTIIVQGQSVVAVAVAVAVAIDTKILLLRLTPEADNDNCCNDTYRRY